MRFDTPEHRESVKQRIKDLIEQEYQGYKATTIFKEVLLKEVISDYRKEDKENG